MTARAVAGAVWLVALSLGCDRQPAVTESADPEFDRARALSRERRHEEAAEEYARLARRFDPAEEPERHWRAVVQSARSLFRSPRKDDALREIRRAQQLAGGDPARELRSAYYHTTMLHTLGRLDEALAQAERAVEWSERVDDVVLACQARSVLATVFSLMGRYGESLAIHEELVRRLRGADVSPVELADALNEVGIDYKHFGRFDDARRVYEEALGILAPGVNDRSRAMVLFNLANVDLELGDARSALPRYFESLELAEAGRDAYGLGLLHNSIGKTYAEAGNLDRAAQHLQRALEINIEERQAYAGLGTRAGLIAVKLRNEPPDLEEADRLARELVEEADAGGYGFQSAEGRILSALVEIEAGRAGPGLAWAEEAVSRAETIGDPNLRIQALTARARAQAALGRRTEAAHGFEQAIALLESWRGRLEVGDLLVGLSRPRLALFEDAVDNLVELGRAEAAFEVAERARARLLLELMGRRRRSDVAEAGDRLLERMRERQRAASRVRSDEVAGRIEREVETLIDEFESFAAAARRDDPVAAASRFPRPMKTAEIRSFLVSGQRAVLGVFWGETQVYGWWVDADGTRVRRLGSAPQLASTVDFLRALLERPGADWRPAARRVFELLIEPLGPSPVELLLAVVDGPLNRLPLEVLIPRKNEAPWGLDQRIVYGPSASVLAAQAAHRRSSGAGRELLAVGAPAIDTRASNSAYRQHPPLAPLPHAEAEVRFIYDLYRDGGATLLLADDATLDAWLAADPGNHRYLHFATHAIVSDRHPEQTHLVLTGGRLDLATIRVQRLRAELVSVSACESAIGKRVRGEGVIGLPHAFLASGARGVIVALWRVEDRSAAEFMREFHAELRGGLEPAEALRRVRRRWIEARDSRAQPERWAPFIQVGGIR